MDDTISGTFHILHVKVSVFLFGRGVRWEIITKLMFILLSIVSLSRWGRACMCVRVRVRVRVGVRVRE